MKTGPIRLAMLTCLFLLVPCAAAQPQTNLTTPTGWAYLSNATLAQVDAQIDLGMRLVDIEVEDDSPLRFSAVFVRNSGDYAKSWWWFFGQTAADVGNRLDEFGARLIDLEPYQTPDGLRFAVVMIRNSGDDFTPEWYWNFGLTGPQLEIWVAANPTQRIIDIQSYDDGGVKYAWCSLRNSGLNASGWWYYYGVDLSFISNQLGALNARLIDLEEDVPNSGLYSCVMVPNDGQPWWWFPALSSFGDIDTLADQLGARAIDYQRYFVGGSARYGVIFRPNTDALTQSINLAMRATTDGSSGFRLKRLNGSNLAGINPDFVFEPASLLKTVHHVHAMRQVALGNDSLANAVVLSVQTTMATGSCPIPLTPPQLPTLETTLRQMMEVSSNAHTEATRQRYGTAAILGTAAALGMTETDLNHTLGCLCSAGVNNWLTLDELGSLHDAVGAGYVFPFRDEFYDLMRNSLTTNPVNGTTSYQNVLDQELGASSLSSADQNEFESLVYQATKDGAYSCTFLPSTFIRHRTEGGYFRIPRRTAECRIVQDEYYFGAFVNDATSGTNAQNAVNIAMIGMFRDRVRDGIASFEANPCVPCSPADLAMPYGVLNFNDVITFLNAFGQMSPIADLAPPSGVFNFNDVIEYLTLFAAGCP